MFTTFVNVKCTKTQVEKMHTLWSVDFQGPTSKGEEGVEGGMERGRDLPDRCQTASYAPELSEPDGTRQLSVSGSDK